MSPVNRHGISRALITSEIRLIYYTNYYFTLRLSFFFFLIWNVNWHDILRALITPETHLILHELLLYPPLMFFSPSDDTAKKSSLCLPPPQKSAPAVKEEVDPHEELWARAT